MKEIPILFSTDMVKSNLAGNKTETRRMVKGTALDWLAPDLFTPEFVASPENNLCPYGQPGDWLWVRESFFLEKYFNGLTESCFIKYKADFDGPVDWNWKPSIHMPKSAARIWLQVEETKIEHLHDIAEDAAIAEGVIEYEDGTYANYFTQKGLRSQDGVECLLAKGSYQSLWCAINGKDSWDLNPWVWVVKYKVLSTTGKPERKEAAHA